MFLNGSLENFSVADILQLLSFSKQTGALHVTGEVSGVLYLDDGEAYFATKEGSRPLEDTVAAAGIPREDWNAALESAGQSHAAGHALTERGVAADLIGYVVHHIVSDTTFELMRMPPEGGSFDFRVGEKHAVGPVHRLRVDELVAEVRDRLAEWDAISEFISSPSDLVSAPSELADDSIELSVSREQWALLVATIRNDRATVSDLARETGRSEAEVASALHPLISSGLMEVEARSDAAVTEPAAPEVTYSPPPPLSVFEADPGPLAPEVPEVIEELGSFGFPPAPDSSDSDYSDEVMQEAPSPEPPEPPEEEQSDQDETTLSWDPVEAQTEGLPSEQTELEIIEPGIPEPVGDSEAWFPAVPEEAPEETSLWSDPETDPLDPSRPGLEPEAEDSEAQAAGAGDPIWDLEGADADLEEEQPAEEPYEELPLSPAETIDVGSAEVESAGFRTLALQDLRDLAGTASVQPATGPRPSNSKTPTAETSDDKPAAQPKVRALKRLIAAVRGL